MSAPTLDLTRPRTIRGVIAGAFECYGGHPGLFAALAAVVVVPWGVVIWLVEGESLLTQGHRHGTRWLVELAISTLIVGPLISALHVKAVSDLGEGRRPQLASVLVRGLRVVPVVAAADVAAGLAIVAGFLCLIVPGVILWARWGVVAQVAAMEDVSWIDCLRLSWQRTRGAALHVLGVIIVAGVSISVIDLLVGSRLRAGDHAGPIVIGIVVQTILLSFQALITAILYFDVGARSGTGRAVS